MASFGALVGGPLGEEDVEELRSERSIRGLKVNINFAWAIGGLI